MLLRSSSKTQKCLHIQIGKYSGALHTPTSWQRSDSTSTITAFYHHKPLGIIRLRYNDVEREVTLHTSQVKLGIRCTMVTWVSSSAHVSFQQCILNWPRRSSRPDQTLQAHHRHSYARSKRHGLNWLSLAHHDQNLLPGKLTTQVMGAHTCKLMRSKSYTSFYLKYCKCRIQVK